MNERMYSMQDWWQTSPITEIIQESIDDAGFWKVRFKTRKLYVHLERILMTDKTEEMWELLAQLGEAMEESNSKLDQMVDVCPDDLKIAITRWAMKHIVEHAQEGGTFRYLIYDRMGFDESAYVPLCDSGMTISNEFDLNLKTELAKALKINNISKAKEVLNLCDEPGCFDEASSGWPAKNGRYRRTCGNHYHEITKICDSEDGDKMCNDCNCWKHTRSMCG